MYNVSFTLNCRDDGAFQRIIQERNTETRRRLLTEFLLPALTMVKESIGYRDEKYFPAAIHILIQSFNELMANCIDARAPDQMAVMVTVRIRDDLSYVTIEDDGAGFQMPYFLSKISKYRDGRMPYDHFLEEKDKAGEVLAKKRTTAFLEAKAIAAHRASVVERFVPLGMMVASGGALLLSSKSVRPLFVTVLFLAWVAGRIRPVDDDVLHKKSGNSYLGGAEQGLKLRNRECQAYGGDLFVGNSSDAHGAVITIQTLSERISKCEFLEEAGRLLLQNDDESHSFMASPPRVTSEFELTLPRGLFVNTADSTPIASPPSLLSPHHGFSFATPRAKGVDSPSNGSVDRGYGKGCSN